MSVRARAGPGCSIPAVRGRSVTAIRLPYASPYNRGLRAKLASALSRLRNRLRMLLRAQARVGVGRNPSGCQRPHPHSPHLWKHSRARCHILCRSLRVPCPWRFPASRSRYCSDCSCPFSKLLLSFFGVSAPYCVIHRVGVPKIVRRAFASPNL